MATSSRSRQTSTEPAAAAVEPSAAAAAPEPVGVESGHAADSTPAPGVIRSDVVMSEYDIPTAYDTMVDVSVDPRDAALSALMQPPPVMASEANPPAAAATARRNYPQRTGVIHTWPDNDDNRLHGPVDNNPATRPAVVSFLVWADSYQRAYFGEDPDKAPVMRSARRGDIVYVSDNTKTAQHVALGHLIPWDPTDQTAGLL